MSRAGLSRIWSVLGALLALYSIGTWIILQGGKSFAELPGLDGRAPITSAYEAVLIVGTLLGILSGVGILYVRSNRTSGEALLPVVAIADAGSHKMNSWSMRLYQAFFFAGYLLIPVVSLYQLNGAVLQRGVLWHEKDAALGAILVRNAFFGTKGTDKLDPDEYACHGKVERAGEFVWLANTRCDIVKAKRLKPFGTVDSLTDAEAQAPSCVRDLAVAMSKEMKCEAATDISELCESSERHCRGIEWLPIISPLLLLGATLFGWLTFISLLVQMCRRGAFDPSSETASADI